MSADKIAILQEIYDNFLQERKDINKKIKNNTERIAEIDAFLKSVYEENDSDFKVFSPRSAETIYKEKIEEHKNEKTSIENENQIQYRKLNVADKNIEKLEVLLFEINKEPQKVNEEPQEEKFALKVLDFQEKERQRIARELHDSSVQNLTHLVHSIELSSMFIDQDPIRAKLELETCITNLRNSINQIRETIFDLRPMTFDDLGFKKCLEEFLNNMSLQYPDCHITYNISEIEIAEVKEIDIRNSELVLLTLYRIIQEAVINSLKHSQANELSIHLLKKENSCIIEVADNGKGFSLETMSEHKDRHFGIYIMKERVELLGGNISIKTEMNHGTMIDIEIPLLKCMDR